MIVILMILLVSIFCCSKNANNLRDKDRIVSYGKENEKDIATTGKSSSTNKKRKNKKRNKDKKRNKNKKRVAIDEKEFEETLIRGDLIRLVTNFNIKSWNSERLSKVLDVISNKLVIKPSKNSSLSKENRDALLAFEHIIKHLAFKKRKSASDHKNSH